MLNTGVIYEQNEETIITRAKLLGSFLLFIKTFYKLRTHREFIISQPVGRESHFLTICRQLTDVFYLKPGTTFSGINIPPGHGKSEIMIHFVAWAMAHYPDCNFLYVSYQVGLAKTHTTTIKQIMELPLYRKLFGVHLNPDICANHDFATTAGGRVSAFGSEGGVTGRNAGLPGVDRFSGCVVMDDMHNPVDIHSPTVRATVIRNYNLTIKQRPRGKRVPIIFIGQVLHEEDLAMYLRRNEDGRQWMFNIICALDECENALYPEEFPKDNLIIMRETDPYNYAAQMQQNPQPAGGGIFKPEWFQLKDDEPKILATFITADTAETDKDYNDATVFSFWGIYKIEEWGIELDLYALHWLACQEIRVEPKDLRNEFAQFYGDCLRYKVKPEIAFIEKKSTGATLLSVLGEFQGIRVQDVPRNRRSKIDRFMSCQRYVASKQISFTRQARHAHACIEHLRKITANNSHRFDDICDTMADAIQVALIDKIVFNYSKSPKLDNDKANEIMGNSLIAQQHYKTIFNTDPRGRDSLWK